MGSNFNQPQHLIEQCHKALTKVKKSDEWTDQALADLVPGMSRSTVNSLTSDDTRLAGTNALGYYLALAKELWEKGNSRLVDVIRPPGVYDAYREPHHRPNGKIEDEISDGVEALGRLRIAWQSNDPEDMAEARQELRNVEERAEEEEARLRERLSQSTILDVEVPDEEAGGDGEAKRTESAQNHR